MSETIIERKIFCVIKEEIILYKKRPKVQIKRILHSWNLKTKSRPILPKNKNEIDNKCEDSLSKRKTKKIWKKNKSNLILIEPSLYKANNRKKINNADLFSSYRRKVTLLNFEDIKNLSISEDAQWKIIMKSFSKEIILPITEKKAFELKTPCWRWIYIGKEDENKL